MTKKKTTEANAHWWRNIKIKGLMPLVCKNNPEHKFIKTKKGQKLCPFCLRGSPYPPPRPANWFAEWDDHRELIPKEILDW